MIRSFITKFAMTVGLLAIVIAPSSLVVTGNVSAQAAKDLVCDGVDLTGTGGSGCDTGTAETEVNTTIQTVINIFSVVVGVVAVIMIIIGGLKYITSGGDSGNISSAKNTILYAIIGLVVVAFAQIIVIFVLDKIR